MLVEEKTETFYITKYALTRGIIKAVGSIDTSLGMADVVLDKTGSGFRNYIHKPFWHLKEEYAIEHAENMRNKKIKSLEKQIERLKNLKFKKE